LFTKLINRNKPTYVCSKTAGLLVWEPDPQTMQEKWGTCFSVPLLQPTG